MRPVSAARLRSIACAFVGASGVGRRDFRAHDVAGVEQPLAVRRPAGRAGAPADRARRAAPAACRRSASSAGLGGNLDHRGALARHGHRRIQQRLAQRHSLCGEDERARSVSCDSMVARSAFSLTRDVEQRAGVAGGGGSVCHWYFQVGRAIACGIVSQARNTRLYHVILRSEAISLDTSFWREVAAASACQRRPDPDRSTADSRC